MDNHFTKEGLELATFKLCLENNAMLKTIMNTLSRLFVLMPDNGISMGDDMERLREQYEENMQKMALVHEQMIVPHVADFAAEHDPTLGVYSFKS